MQEAVAVGLALAAIIAWSVGSNDLANSTSIVVGSGVLTFRRALAVFLVGLTLGAYLQGFMVMKTLGKGVVPDVTPPMAIASALAAFLWITLSSYIGAPISTSQSITGAVIGVALGRWIVTGELNVNFGVVKKILLSWVVSPVIAMALAYALYRVLTSNAARGLLEKRRALAGTLIATSFMSAYAFGANDVANATGAFVTMVQSAWGAPDLETMRALSLYASAFIFVGGLTFGERVLRTMAYRITRLDLISGLASGIANFLVVWLFTTLPYYVFGFGLPISTTYACAGSIIGAGIARVRSLRGVNARTVVFIMFAWVITLPATIGLGIPLYILVRQLLGGV